MSNRGAQNLKLTPAQSALLREGEWVDRLDGGALVIQGSGGYTFTSDSLRLARFARAKTGERGADIGAGSGVIALMLCAKARLKEIYAVEIRQEAAQMCERSVKLSGLESTVSVLNMRVQDSLQQIGKGTLDFAVCNPPYSRTGSGETSLDTEIGLCRHEGALTMDELISCARALLRFGGRFYTMYPASRAAELIYKLHAGGLEPKTLQFVSPKPGKPPYLVLVHASRGAKPGLSVLPEL